jgi:putative transposase
LYSKQLRKRIFPNSELAEDTPEPETSLAKKIICPKCNGLDVVKREVRRTKRGTGIQRYWRKSCNYRFVRDSGFDRARADPKVITAALDLYFKGISLRKVCEHLKHFHDVQVSHVAVLKWIRKFVRLVRPYVDQIEPSFLGGIFNVDEMMVHVRKEKTDKGHFAWLWNLMDATTRYWICARISQKREIADARSVVQQAKDRSKMKPKAVIHDGLRAYDKALDKEFFTMRQPRTLNVRSVSVRHEGLNSKIERLNGTVRDREVVMRGMDHKESAQDLMDGKRIEYNFARGHQALGGKTPAEVAGIKIAGEKDDNIWIKLVKNAKAETTPMEN